MALPGLGPFAGTAVSASNAAATANSADDDPSKKIRKPYTISKSRESWTEPEHDKFLEAIQLFDRDWKKIEAFIGSKTVIQIRSHAQKYFLKVQKSGTNEHLPPPRPKRKAAHPYPQKASKNAQVPALPQISEAFQSPSTLLEPGFIQMPDSTLRSPLTSVGISSRTNSSLQTKAPSMVDNCCSSAKIIKGGQPVGEINDQGNPGYPLRVLPDFAKVYGFIGSVFDPDASGHLQNLKKMERIDVETVLLLMRNLSINLTSPDFEAHRTLLASYEVELDSENHNEASKIDRGDLPMNVA